ncbi:MAG: ATP synthase F1 subunit delta [Cyanobium sp.]
MPLLNSITTPYAEAFLQVSEARGETDQAISQARDLLSLWHGSDELRQALASPVIEVEAKKALIEKLFAAELSPAFLNLLKLLADRQRIGFLDAVIGRLLELYREQRGIALVTVTSATPLNADQQAEVAAKAKAIAGTEQVEISTATDPSLIGGFVLRVGSKVIDASLAGQIRRLGLALAKVS